MSSQNQIAKNFFHRAQREAHRYGENPWVFLRELVQNSRDAGAGTIQVETSQRDGWDILICRDDGVGMTQSDFESYFLRLYASSKEQHAGSIGFFGVGFWSVLLFKPRTIRVLSRKDEDTVAIEIDCKTGLIETVALSLPEPGTEIAIVRSRDSENEIDLDREVSGHLAYYAAHVRPLPGKPTPALYCNGEPLNREFSLPISMGKRFKTSKYDGVIGFGETPSVKLYKGGILVRDLTSLEEVIPSRSSGAPKGGWRLFPEMAVNVDGIQVLMDRQKIFEDPLLSEVVEYCESWLLNQHRKMVKQVFPMNFKNRLFLLRRFFKRRWGIMLAVTVVALMGFWLVSTQTLSSGESDSAGLSGWELPSGRSLVGRQKTIDQAWRNLSGSVIDPNGNSATDWAFRYQGPDRLLFRARTFARFESQSGFYPEPHLISGDYPALWFRAQRPHVTVEMKVAALNQWVALPLPPKYVLIKDSISSNRGPVSVMRNQYGEPVIRSTVPLSLSYRAQEQPENNPSSSGLKDPLISWPEPYEALLKRAMDVSVPQKVDLFSRHIVSQFKYTREKDIADAFANSEGSWLEKTLTLRAGDCDVLNGLVVLLLQSAGVNSGLSVGLIGERGMARSELHAWVRYFDGEWKTLDLTRRLETLGSGSSQPPLSADMNPVPPQTDPIATGTTGPPQPSPSSLPAGGNAGILLAGVLLCFGLGGLVIFVLLQRRRPEIDRSAYAESLFLHYFHHGPEQDDLRLKYRPIFPLLNGRFMSLHEIQIRATEGRLFGGFPGSSQNVQLKGNVQILDRTSPMVQTLEQFLPAIGWLEDAEPLLTPTPLPAGLQAVEDTVRTLDPDFRLHLLPGSDSFREMEIPFKNAALGKRHFLLGADHPLAKVLLNQSEKGPVDLFHRVQLLLNKMTIYLNDREAFLVDLARQTHGEPAAGIS